MELARVNRPNSAVVFHPRGTPGMDVATPDPAGAFVFHPPSRRRRHHHHHRSHYYDNRHHYSDSDTDSTFSTRSSCSSSSFTSDCDDDGSPYYHHRVSFRPRHPARRRRWWGGWPRGGMLAYPDSYYASPWAANAVGAGVVGVPAAPAGFVTTAAGTLMPQIQLQQTQGQTQQQPRRYGYRRFHYQGGERVRSRGCGHGHGHGHGHHHHHNGSAPSPRRCILPRFGRWLVGDPPDRVRRGRRCEDGCGGECCDHGCGVGVTATTPTVHHEDEYWGPGAVLTLPLRGPFSSNSRTPIERSASGPSVLTGSNQQHSSNIPNWATGSQNSPWRYGGPNGNQNNGPGDTVGPGGTIEEVEEGGTAPAAAAASVQPTSILPVPVATPTALDSYDRYSERPKHTHHYHLNDEDRQGGRSSRHRHGRRHRDDGILGLVERERRRDSERQMADADASHRREAMMMELMERARRGERDRDRDRDRGGDGAGLDARDILGVLLDGVTGRKGRRDGRGDVVEMGGEESGRDDGLKGALDALSRRVDEMVLSDREQKGRPAERVPAPVKRKIKQDVAPRVKFSKVDSDYASAANRRDGSGLSGRKKGAAVNGKLTFGRRGKDGDQADIDSDETSGPPLPHGGRSVKRGRTLRRAGSTSTSAD